MNNDIDFTSRDRKPHRRRRSIVATFGGIATAGLAATVVIAGLANRTDDKAVRDGQGAQHAIDQLGASVTATGPTGSAQGVGDPYTPAPAQRADAPMTWQIVDDPEDGLGSASGRNASITDGYAISTMPGRGTAGQNVVYASSDAVDWTPASGTPLDDLWLIDVAAGADAGQVYGIGTAPSKGAVNVPDLVSAISTDGGASFDVQPLPIDLPAVRRELGFNSVGDSQLATHGGAAVAAISVGGFPDPVELLPDGIDAPFGATLGADGIGIYAAPTDLDVIGGQLCPDGWPLRAGQPDQPSLDSIPGGVDVPGGGVASTIAIGGKGPGSAWHCAAPDTSDADDLFVDGQLVHGAISQTVGYDQLGLSPDSVLTLQQRSRVFVATDGGAWTPVDMPSAALGSPEFLVATDAGFAMTLVTSRAAGSATRTLWLSADGSTWQQGALPTAFGLAAMGNGPDGGLLLVGYVGRYVAVARSTDGTAWTVNALNALVGADPSLQISIERTVSSTAGVIMVVNVGHDELASRGGAELRHGSLTLRIEDHSGTYTLLDDTGATLDVVSGFSPPDASGPLRGTDAGYAVIDEVSGETLTNFTFAEIQAAINDIAPLDEVAEPAGGEGAQSVRYVISSADGVHFAAEQLASIGLIGGNRLYVSDSFATDHSLVLNFADGAGCCDPSLPPAPPLVLIATPAG